MVGRKSIKTLKGNRFTKDGAFLHRYEGDE